LTGIELLYRKFQLLTQ